MPVPPKGKSLRERFVEKITHARDCLNRGRDATPQEIKEGDKLQSASEELDRAEKAINEARDLLVKQMSGPDDDDRDTKETEEFLDSIYTPPADPPKPVTPAPMPHGKKKDKGNA